MKIFKQFLHLFLILRNILNLVLVNNRITQADFLLNIEIDQPPGHTPELTVAGIVYTEATYLYSRKKTHKSEQKSVSKFKMDE